MVPDSWIFLCQNLLNSSTVCEDPEIVQLDLGQWKAKLPGPAVPKGSMAVWPQPNLKRFGFPRPRAKAVSIATRVFFRVFRSRCFTNPSPYTRWASWPTIHLAKLRVIPKSTAGFYTNKNHPESFPCVSWYVVPGSRTGICCRQVQVSQRGSSKLRSRSRRDAHEFVRHAFRSVRVECAG